MGFNLTYETEPRKAIGVGLKIHVKIFDSVLHLVLIYSEKMAAVAGQALLGKEEVWLRGCTERRYAT